MNVPSLLRQFERIGAEIEVDTIAPGAVRDAGTPARRLALNEGYGLDVIQERRNERYSLIVRADLTETLEFTALDVQPRMRHLLLMARRTDEDGVPVSGGKSKFLCGHDERHWFVAVPRETVSSVNEAMEALKPGGVARVQQRLGVRAKDWNRRKNAGFIRQGEWFFIPEPDFVAPSNALILKDEPLRRGGTGKPHTIEFLYRFGGEEIQVCDRYPNGVSPAQYRRLMQNNPAARSWNWRTLRRNPRVFAKGKVSHADHATITLPFWHQVLMNTEQVVTANGQISRNVSFID